MSTTIWQELNRRLHLQRQRDEELERLRSINASLEKAVIRLTHENETLTQRLASYDGTYQRMTEWLAVTVTTTSTPSLENNRHAHPRRFQRQEI